MEMEEYHKFILLGHRGVAGGGEVETGELADRPEAVGGAEDSGLSE